MAMMVATMPSMHSVDLSLAGFRLPEGSCTTATLAGFGSAALSVCTECSPSPHEADDYGGANNRRRLAAILLFGACRCERTGVAHVVPGGLDPAVGALDVRDAERVDMAVEGGGDFRLRATRWESPRKRPLGFLRTERSAGAAVGTSGVGERREK
jgi:hypothetical protein